MGYIERKSEVLDAPEMTAELKKMQGDVKSALDQLHKAVDTKNTETVKKVEEFLTKYEAEASKHAKALKIIEDAKAEAEKKAADLDGRVKDLEQTIATKGVKSDADGRDAPEYKAFETYVKKGVLNDALEAKTLRTDSDTAGGFLIPTPMDTELRKNITEISPVRMFCRVRTMSGKTLEVPRRIKGLGRAPFEGELESGDEGISQYGQETVTVYRQSWTVPISMDMLMSSAFNMEAEMIQDVFEAFANGEGYNCLFGTGVKGPKGIVADSRCEVVSTATTGVLAFEDFATIIGKMKRGQQIAFFMNRTTLSEIWKLKGTDGHPIWSPVPSGGTSPATIFGVPYSADMIDLDSHVPTTSNTKPIICGDLRRGYEIFDRAGISLVRDDYTKKKQSIVEFTFTRYLTGQVILPEAIKILKIK
ncbi:MAG: phage major capsid protein [Hyphomicrobium sp.]|nr:phage major capsid protein [Hyphomicrobium sp.]